MSECQQASLLQWLEDMQRRHGNAPKFVASPSILLPRKLEWAMRSLDVPPGTPGRASLPTTLRSESWAGYPARENGSRAQDIRSIHSSTLYAPLPFANAERADFHRDDEFCFAPPPIAGAPAGRYRCNSHVEFPDIRYGFARVLVSRAGGAWKGEVTFHDADPAVPAPAYRW
jgi:cholesterol oxidase